MKIIKMPKTILEHVRSSELPDTWKRKLEATPNQTFTITIEPEIADVKPVKGKWARVAEEMAKENILAGVSEETIKNSQDFRTNFSFRNIPFDK
jgi:hypothetical protein